VYVHVRYIKTLKAKFHYASDLLASWIAPDRPNSITLSSSLAAQYQVADQLANQLTSWFANWIA